MKVRLKKQQDPAPRYQARDVAVFMGHHYNSKVVLGSATPSLETSYNVNKGKYGLYSLKQRFGGFNFPKIHIIDIAHAYKRKRMNGHFSEALLMAIQDTLEQVSRFCYFKIDVVLRLNRNVNLVVMCHIVSTVM